MSDGFSILGRFHLPIVTSKPPPESAARPTGGILLVEEYGALQVAITSALRKFAPSYEVLVARRFAGAEAAAEQMRPDLFLLDIDPPPSGEITIFQRLKAQHPDARMLVLAAGTSRELRAERSTAGAIQFIEKPFDLAEFGATVQALLGQGKRPRSPQSRGTLSDLHLIDLVQLKCLALSNGVLRLETDDGQSGAIYFRRGQICHAVTGSLEGAPAFAEILKREGWHLSETDLPVDLPATINVAWPDLLVPVARRLTIEIQKKSEAVAATAPQPSSSEQDGKKILIVDDTEMLLIFVADTLSTANPALQILTASTGAEGIRLAATAQPDLILLDYSLTDMTGDNVCRALLENPTTARTPILMMSGHLTELTRTARSYRNVAAALAKPFLSNALVNEVDRLLAAGPLQEVRTVPTHPMTLIPPSKPVAQAENPVPGSPLLSAARLSAASDEDEPKIPTPTPEPASLEKRSDATASLAPPDPVADVTSAPEPLSPTPSTPAEPSPPPASEPSHQPPPASFQSTVATAVSPEAEPSKAPATSSPNGHANKQPESTSRAAEESVISLHRESREKTVTEPQKSVATAQRPTAESVTPSSPLVRPTQVSVTLALEVGSMQLTSSFRMETARLQPCSPLVSVKMDERSDLRGVPLENGFHLGTIRLLDDGLIDTMRLVPTRRRPQLPVAKSSFAIREMSLERSNAHQNLRFTGQTTEAMRVHLTTKCELVGVELSVAFEVLAVTLRVREKTVMVRNTLANKGAEFALEEVELDASAELRGLLVRAVH